jgi:uncharacterized membrane protein
MKILQIVLLLIIGFVIGVTSLYFDTRFNKPTEYQFTVIDDSISVTDFDREVGTVLIEGQLKELINKDNE